MMKNMSVNAIVGFCLISILLLLSLSLSAKNSNEISQTAVISPVKTVGSVKLPVVQQPETRGTNAPVTTGVVKPPVVQQPAKPRIPTQELIKRLNTTNTTQIIETIKIIGNQDSGSTSVQEAFAQLLSHKEESVRQAVLDEAYQFDSLRGLLPALAKSLHDTSETIRDDAIDVLSEIETREMINILVNSLTNEYEDVRDNAEFYLFYHTDEMYTNDYKWFGWWKTNKTTFVFE